MSQDFICKECGIELKEGDGRMITLDGPICTKCLAHDIEACQPPVFCNKKHSHTKRCMIG